MPRLDGIQESVIREMTRLGDEAGAVNLSQGLPDFDPGAANATPPEVLQAALNAIQSGDNQYSFPFGTAAFRQAVAARYARTNHIRANPESEVTITCGVSEAMVATILALTEPGDEAIILEPWYENYLPACRLAGVTPRFVPLREPDYTFDPAELRAAVTPQTRLILVNTPHNPTGRVFDAQELEAIAALCRECDLVAVTDEIYDQILYDGHRHISIGSLAGMEGRTVTTSGLGKSYAVTGWRVGWAVAAAPLSAEIRKVHDYLTICAPTPFQAAGIVALGLDDAYYTALCAQYARQRAILLRALDDVGLPYRIPEGAYYVMADFGGLEWPAARFALPVWTPDRAFAEYLAREVGVVPGSSFYAGSGQGTSRVRFNFAKRETVLYEAAQRLKWLTDKHG
ncbi:MAG: aminotransferase class I/II-fold pyridoxal phosphate-dependent enzyme [Anaerolineae bacterium]|nr:aminotransferase class I/II-fold pyridoxal phosphate-dependent enzyme [Anaerolineae bacterium]